MWVTDTGNNRVLQLPSHSNTTQTALSFTGLNHPHGVRSARRRLRRRQR
ncbi:NHL repeat family protein [Mycobacterium xenopi 4042]|uniref:NHL repeat family protein n=1 Tax=Mycobacterium xenopi 4042 TaxID=1299334 RepID=X8CJU1_MYCXE|nr:NHL repeat family protein [Mycobacterium xenopi 4042]